MWDKVDHPMIKYYSLILWYFFNRMMSIRFIISWDLFANLDNTEA
ncbi:hypothetical protein [Virgibacillus sp. Bac332]|nr:hypothetical protein [Virgibacillus sp. Bac332]